MKIILSVLCLVSFGSNLPVFATPISFAKFATERGLTNQQDRGLLARNDGASVGCPECSPPSEYCVSITSRSGWQDLHLPGSYLKVLSIRGGWSVDDAKYSRVGAVGHTGYAAQSLAPYNQYKYLHDIPFGALILYIPSYIPEKSGELKWIAKPQMLPKWIGKDALMRINDADESLGDNGGALQVCFGQ